MLQIYRAESFIQSNILGQKIFEINLSEGINLYIW